MESKYQNTLRQKVSALVEDLKKLETRCDEISDRPDDAGIPEAKWSGASEAGVIQAQIARLQQGIHRAKRLLARAQGDEYQGWA